MDRFEVARALREIAAQLRVRGGNPFRAKAFEGGARALEGLSEDLGVLVSERRLTEVSGIGPSLARTIEELHATGRSAFLEELRREMPPAILELARVPNVGIKRARVLHGELGIATTEELRNACLDGRVEALPGYGPATVKRILAGLDRSELRATHVTISDAHAIADEALRWFRAAGIDVEVAGAVRRFEELPREVALVALTDASTVERYPPIAEVLERRPDLVRARLASGVVLAVTLATPESRGTALVRATGTPEHIAALEARARERGVSLDGAATEGELYGRLALPVVPAEAREGAGEVEAAAAGDRFEDLVAVPDILGAVHCHTDESDGRATLEEMVLGAEALGFRYITITDHSPAARYARGLTLERIERQWDEIAALQQRVKIRILRGTESDILAEGELDWPDSVVEKLDVVIASIHERHRLDEERMTKRLVRAMKLPFFKVWGHPLGRLVGRREPIGCRVEAVLDAIAASRAAIEISGDPARLDPEPKWIRAARARGIRFVVSSDAHWVAGLGWVRNGVALARRGGVRRGEVLNALDVEAFARAVRPAA